MPPAWWNLWLARGATPSAGTPGAPPPEPELDATAQGLTDIARGMQHVAQSFQDVQGQQFLTVLSHYFDPETGEPLEFRITLPDGMVWDIPFIACFPPTAIGLRKFIAREAVEVHQAEVRQGRYHKGMPEIDRARFRVSLAPTDPKNDTRRRGSARTMDLEMHFEAAERARTPEMVRRIIAHFTDLSRPMKREEADKFGTRTNGTRRLRANVESSLSPPAADATGAPKPPPEPPAGSAVDKEDQI